MTRCIHVAFMFLCSFSIISNAYGQELTKIYMAEGVLARKTDQGVIGAFPDIIREAAKRVGHPIEIIPISWKRGQERAKVEQGAGATPLTRIPPREPHYVWIEEIIPLTLNFFVKSNSTLTPRSIEELAGLNVAIQIGSVADAITRSRTDLKLIKHLVADNSSIVKMLSAARVEGWLIWDIVGLENFREQGMMQDFKSTFSYQVGPLYLATNTTVSDAEITKWRNAIKGMKADGFINKTLKHYYQQHMAELTINEAMKIKKP